MGTFEGRLKTRYQHIFTITVISLLLGGCGGGTMFKLADDKYTVKPTTIGVITGGSEEADLKLAEMLTKELSERTTLKVLSQAEISKAIPSYPTSVKMREGKNTEANPTWFDPTEKKKLKQIQARLKTIYLFVVWGQGLGATQYCRSRGGCTTNYHINVYGNMLEYPSGEVVSHTAFSNENEDSVLALFRPKGYYIEEMLEDSAEEIVDEFIKVTNTGKSSK